MFVRVEVFAHMIKRVLVPKRVERFAHWMKRVLVPKFLCDTRASHIVAQRSPHAEILAEGRHLEDMPLTSSGLTQLKKYEHKCASGSMIHDDFGGKGTQHWTNFVSRLCLESPKTKVMTLLVASRPVFLHSSRTSSSIFLPLLIAELKSTSFWW